MKRADVEIDPNLLEVIDRRPSDTVEAIIRLDGPPPDGVRLVSRFGEFATCRIAVEEIRRIHAAERVVSLKAARSVRPDVISETTAGSMRDSDRRRPDTLGTTGRGVVLGAVDWGPDPTHPDFRTADGSRFLAIWDQRGSFPDSPRPWGYGRVYHRSTIDRELARSGTFDLPGRPLPPGSHGTHVVSIAAGNGGAGGPMGMAPEADLVFVHLSKGPTGGVGDLGDSVRILEAVDFIFRVAAGRPVVVNLSVGAQGGSHDGESALELALDAALEMAPGRAIVQSAGNYFSARCHAEEQLRPGETWILGWNVFRGDPTANELEIWYPGVDRLTVRLVAPTGEAGLPLLLGEGAPITVAGRPVGRAYHRHRDPNNHDHLINCFLDPEAPPGRWRVEVRALDVVDGRCRAWIERDSTRPRAQSRFDASQSHAYGTTGTIANGLRTIAVGAFDPHRAEQPLGPFSSAGPTRDGRQKPDIVAPGVMSLAARSGSNDGGGLLTRKSGTSMASPVVAGTVACMFEAAGRLLGISETRDLLLSTASTRHGEEVWRVGSGRVDPVAAVEAARRLVSG